MEKILRELVREQGQAGKRRNRRRTPKDGGEFWGFSPEIPKKTVLGGHPEWNFWKILWGFLGMAKDGGEFWGFPKKIPKKGAVWASKREFMKDLAGLFGNFVWRRRFGCQAGQGQPNPWNSMEKFGIFWDFLG